VTHENLECGSLLPLLYPSTLCCKGASKLAHSKELAIFEAASHAPVAHPVTHENRLVLHPGSESESLSAFCCIDSDSDTDSDPEAFLLLCLFSEQLSGDRDETWNYIGIEHDQQTDQQSQ
jgi:hypothetical protein